MLTERTIRDAKPTAKAFFIWDKQVKGFGCRVFPTGRKAFVLSYRTDGKKRLATLAQCSEISLADARKKAGAELVAIRDGAADPLRRREQAAAAPTVAKLVDDFLTIEGPRRISIGRLKPRTLKEYERQCGNFAAALGARPVADITRGDIERYVAPLPRVERNRVLACLSRLFTLAEKWEWRQPGSNPTKHVERSREERRERILSPDEMGALADALTEYQDTSPASVAVISFLALTGLRIGEALNLRWDDINLDTGETVLVDTKTGRRSHTLPKTAIEILASLDRKGEWVFTSGGSRPLHYQTVRPIFVKACERAGIEGARIHDLRRGVISAAARSGATVAVLQGLLGHKTPVMALRYAAELGDPVQEYREAVSDQMAAAMGRRHG